MPFNFSNLQSLFLKGSPLFQNKENFESRPEQIQMLEAVAEALDKHQFAFIEAGTGVGKSLAYLLPAIFLCSETSEKCVISTHTITLQEQLLEKDIPFILKSLNLDLEVVLVKGMQNYICLRKLYDQIDNATLNSLDQREELEEIKTWITHSIDGSLSDIPKMPQKIGWDKLNCESDACSYVKCPHYKDCFFFQARKKCKDAHILIANHALILADIASQQDDQTQSSILPEYEHLILDEAHTLEDIATQSLASQISSNAILRKLGDLAAERGGSGLLQKLKKILYEFIVEDNPKLLEEISNFILTEKKVTQVQVVESFIAFSDFLNSEFSKKEATYQKIKLNPSDRGKESFENLSNLFNDLTEQLSSFSLSLSALTEKCLELNYPNVKKRLQNILIDLKALSSYFEKASLIISKFFHPGNEKNILYVIEWDKTKSLSSIKLSIIDLNIADILAQHLFGPRSSSVLCSATLSLNHSFDFIKSQLGFKTSSFDQHSFIEKELLSPFDYENQVLLSIPVDIPDPRSYEYSAKSSDFIKNAVIISQGGAFILFTSYKALNDCYEKISNTLLEEGLLPLKQGDESRHVLLQQFKDNPNSVLFGTDTFWEGIDVPGFHLRLVIITKIPFPVPDEPIFQAKCRLVEEEGQNAFLNYSIPKAIVKFKQGFGRLIRTKNDYGCIVSLDSRLVYKAYGNFFLNSLPKTEKRIGNSETVLEEMKKFYHKKWSVTESNR